MKKRLLLLIICLFIFSSCFLLSACGSNIRLTINFDSNGGTRCKSIEYVVGKSFNMPNNPTKEDYIFAGWFTDNNVWENELTVNSVLNYGLSKDMAITVYAKWFKQVHLVFDSNGGSVCEELFLNRSGLSLPNPTKEDYVFRGWFLDNNSFSSRYKLGDNVIPNSNNQIKLFAKWEYVGESTEIRTVYYVCENQELQQRFSKSLDLVTMRDGIMLYSPEIAGQDFQGWYFDKSFNQPVGDYISFDRVDAKKKYAILYAKFIEKEVDKLTLIGTVKTEYEYGEAFDSNGAKVRVEYKDKNYADEIIDLTEDIVSNFGTTDEVSDARRVSIDVQKKESDRASATMRIRFNSAYLYVGYTIHTDLTNFSVNQDKISFVHGAEIQLSDLGLVSSWEDVNGTTGTTELFNASVCYYRSDDFEIIDKYFGSIGIRPRYNCDLFLSHEIYEDIGTCDAYITFRFKTIKIEYEMLPNDDVEYGELNYGALNYRYPLLKDSYLNPYSFYISLYDNEDNELIDNWNIVFDGFIDTTVAGEQQFKVLYGEREIDVKYYVMDENEIESVTLRDIFTINSYVSKYLSICLSVKMNDGKIVTCYINNKDFETPINVDTPGKKTASFYLNERLLTFEYNVGI